MTQLTLPFISSELNESGLVFVPCANMVSLGVGAPTTQWHAEGYFLLIAQDISLTPISLAHALEGHKAMGARFKISGASFNWLQARKQQYWGKFSNSDAYFCQCTEVQCLLIPQEKIKTAKEDESYMGF